jgi:hypothetical protein
VECGHDNWYRNRVLGSTTRLSDSINAFEDGRYYAPYLAAEQADFKARRAFAL